MTRSRFPALVVALLSSLVCLGLVAACSEAPKLVGEGAACAVTTDCAFGLVCVPQRSGRICTGDVTSIAKATQPPSTDAGRDGDAPPESGGEAGPTDGALPSEAAVDSAPAVDANPEPVDSAAE